MTKLKLYNGEEVVEKGKTKKIDVQELRDDTKREGMNGISTRFIMKALDNALSDNVEGNCINPINVREALINMVKEADLARRHAQAVPRVPAGRRCTRSTSSCSRRRSPRPSSTPTRSRPSRSSRTTSTTPRPSSTRRKVKDRNTKEELQPDEGFLKSIEEQIAIIGSAAEGFRQEVIAYLWAASRRGETHLLPELRAAEGSDREEAHDARCATSAASSPRPARATRSRREKYDAMVQNLLENGYCPSCVDVVLKYAANNLWKD